MVGENVYDSKGLVDIVFVFSGRGVLLSRRGITAHMHVIYAVTTGHYLCVRK
jgi:hypothetical protein